MCFSKLQKLEVLYNMMTKWKNLFYKPRRQIYRTRRKKAENLRPKAVIQIMMMIIIINVVDLPYFTVRSGRGEAAGGHAVVHIHRW